MTVTKQKTWQYNLNGLSPSNASLGSPSTLAHFARRQTLLGIKDALVGFGNQPWTAQTSSDGVTATFAGDRWVDEQDLVWRDDDVPANNFSWIVLRQTGISSKFELLITCEENVTGNDGADIGAWVAQSGFNAADGGTDGTLTSRPTATDERQIRDSTSSPAWGTGPQSGSYSYRYHVMQSDDGECTRVILFIDGVNTGFWIFDKPRNPKTAWAEPYVASINGNNDLTTNQCTYAKYHDAAGGLGAFNGTDTTMYFSGEGFGTNASGENLKSDQLDGTFIASGMGLSSLTSTFEGRNGELYDLWWGFTSVGSGRYFPAAGGKNFVQISNMIFPWDGSTIIGMA